INMYGIPDTKVELLPLGLDDSLVDFEKKEEIRSSIRAKLNISSGAFVIVTGGKIDARKNIHNLMNAVINLNHPHIKLIVFGTPNEQMEDMIQKLSSYESIINVGWISPEKVNEYFMASDLAFFPGTHSVLWEQAVGIGLPCVFRKWKGIQHVDVGGNCLFIDDGSVDEIKKSILKVYQNIKLYKKMKNVSETAGAKKFLYSEIAKKAIGL
ncbi:MAG: glycosyltransferase, partial [Desulfuromonadales bacterium]